MTIKIKNILNSLEYEKIVKSIDPYMWLFK